MNGSLMLEEEKKGQTGGILSAALGTVVFLRNPL
jgi:hypothetical protein